MEDATSFFCKRKNMTTEVGEQKLKKEKKEKKKKPCDEALPRTLAHAALHATAVGALSGKKRKTRKKPC